MAPRTKKPTDQPPASVAAPETQAAVAEPTPPPEPKPKPMSNLQRVKLMNNLVAATENHAVLEAFVGLQDGEKIKEIFMNAVDAEVAKLMGGEDSEENLQLAGQVGQQLKQAAVAIGQFHQAVAAISRSPIMELLQRLMGQTGGRAPVTAPPQHRPSPDGPDILHPDGAEGHQSRQSGRQPNYVLP